MWSKKTSGLIGMIVGAIWFLANVRHLSEQGLPLSNGIIAGRT